MKSALSDAWYKGHPALWLLLPLSLLYGLLSMLRRALYGAGIFRVARFDAPVIVVGNITAGGTGKTPLTLALIEELRRHGWRPGVVSRGYGGRADYPLRLSDDTTAAEAGDEPVMLFRRSRVPLMVDPCRSRAVRRLLEQEACDVILCDDGLQHYALGRDIEIAVIDGSRGVGNGLLLPAGPLREPVSRLRSVDFVVVNGEGNGWPGAYPMRLAAESWQPVGSQTDSPPAKGSRVHAVAGIGNPERFFSQLRAEGYDVIPHAFPDHHAYSAQDLGFGDGLPVVMTEKDMVKCRVLSGNDWWYVPVSAELPARFAEDFLRQLNAKAKVRKNAG